MRLPWDHILIFALGIFPQFFFYYLILFIRETLLWKRKYKDTLKRVFKLFIFRHYSLKSASIAETCMISWINVGETTLTLNLFANKQEKANNASFCFLFDSFFVSFYLVSASKKVFNGRFMGTVLHIICIKIIFSFSFFVPFL